MLGLLALITATMFFGAAIYINIAEHPARLGLETEAAWKQWAPSYAKGFAMQASLAVISGLAGAGAWWMSGDPLLALGAVVIIANWPYTLLIIMPVNKRLLAMVFPNDQAEMRQLLVRWGQLHAVRSGLGALATLLFYAAALPI